MTTINRCPTQSAGNAPTTAGMLLSLSHALPNPSSPLGVAARRLADRLAHDQGTAADHSHAAALLARLLDETDVGLAWDEDGLLDEAFDA